MARTAIGVIMTMVVVGLSAAASYVAYLRSVEPGTVVNFPVREQPVRPAPPAQPVVKVAPPAQPEPVVQPAPPVQPTLPVVETTPQVQPPAVQPVAGQPAKLPLVYVADGVLGGGPAFNQSLGGIAIDEPRNLLYAVGDRSAIVYYDLKTGKLAGRCQTHRVNLSIGVDAAGAIYVGEEGRAEKYSRQPNGQWQRDFKIGDRQLQRVTAIRVIGDQIVCADAGARKIVFYDDKGQPLNRQIPAKQIALAGKSPQRILLPNDTLDFSVNIARQIVMAQPGRHSVQTYSVTGTMLKQWGRFDEHQPDGFSGCCNPINVATFPLLVLGRDDLTARGQAIVTAEKGPARVKVYDENGKLLSLIGPEQFNQNNRRMYLAVDKQARIYVADTDAKTIRRFKPEK